MNAYNLYFKLSKSRLLLASPAVLALVAHVVAPVADLGFLVKHEGDLAGEKVGDA